jgi:hypothetical protein
VPWACVQPRRTRIESRQLQPTLPVCSKSRDTRIHLSNATARNWIRSWLQIKGRPILIEFGPLEKLGPVQWTHRNTTNTDQLPKHCLRHSGAQDDGQWYRLSWQTIGTRVRPCRARWDACTAFPFPFPSPSNDCRVLSCMFCVTALFQTPLLSAFPGSGPIGYPPGVRPINLSPQPLPVMAPMGPSPPSNNLSSPSATGKEGPSTALCSLSPGHVQVRGALSG